MPNKRESLITHYDQNQGLTIGVWPNRCFNTVSSKSVRQTAYFFLDISLQWYLSGMALKIGKSQKKVLKLHLTCYQDPFSDNAFL